MHNRQKFGELLKSILGEKKSIIDSSLLSIAKKTGSADYHKYMYMTAFYTVTSR